MTAQQIDDARRTSIARVLDAWSKLEERYTVPLEDDDIVDLATGRIVQDRGVLRGISVRAFGGETETETETDAEEDAEDDEVDEESEDELGRWPGDEQRKVDPRLQWLRDSSGPTPLDKEELASFLRAEQQRKRLEGDIDSDLPSTSTANHRPSATEHDDSDNDNDNDNLDAPLPQIVESGGEDLESIGSAEDESDDELLLTEEVEPRPPASPTPTPSPAKNRARLITPAQLYTPPRSQSIDSPVLRRTVPSSANKTPFPNATPSRDRTGTPRSNHPTRRSNMVMEVVMPTPSTSKRRDTTAPPVKRRVSEGSANSIQPLPSPSSSTPAELPMIDFNDMKWGRTSPRKTPAPDRMPRYSQTPGPSSTRSNTRYSSRRPSIEAPPSSPLKGKGKAKASSMFMSPDSDEEQSASPVRAAVGSPRKRKRSSPSGSENDLGASPTKRRPSQAPTASIAHPPHPPAPPWPVTGPNTLPFPAASTAPQQALIAQFLTEVQRMNMLAQAMLPNFWASSSGQPPHPPPPETHTERSRSRLPRRSHSADELEHEHEYEPVTPEKARSRSALRTPGSARSSVRKHVTFWLHRDGYESDEEQRGRVKARVRGTPAPGRSPR